MMQTLFEKAGRKIGHLARTRVQWPLRRLIERKASVNVRGSLIKLGVASEIEHYRATTYESKEPETLDWIESEFRTGQDVLFDIGANVGIFTLFAAAKNPVGKIFAFEPEAQNYARLCQNLVDNGVKNVTPCNFPLDEKTRYGTFYVSSLELGSSMHSFGKVSDFQNSPYAAFEQGSVAWSLDELIERFGFPIPTCIKLDVDGLEEQIIAGAKKTLTHPKVRSILVELSAVDAEAVKASYQCLLNLGFRLTRQSEWCYEVKGLKTWNFIFSKS